MWPDRLQAQPQTGLRTIEAWEAWAENQRPSRYPKLTLWCLDCINWRVECVRLCLFSAGVPFDDRRVTYTELHHSGRLRFGTFPVLEVNGRIIAQAHAIATYVGKLTGFFPSDPWLAAKVDEVLGGLADATDLLANTIQEMDLERKICWRQSLISDDGRLTVMLSGLEGILDDNRQAGLSAGNDVSIADFAIWSAVGWISSSLEGIPQDYVPRGFPHLWNLHKQMDTLACVKEWKERHPQHYRLMS
eukprot:UN0817